VLYLT